MNAKNVKGVSVIIVPTSNYPTPFGLKYEAKGFYIQKNKIVVVGNLENNNTMRIKYPVNDVSINIKYKSCKN